MELKELLTGGSSDELQDLRDALIEELKDLYSAENQLVKALPKMEKGATNPKLKKAIRDHLEETKGQVERLEEISSELGEKLTGETCKGMQGLIEEGKKALEEKSDKAALVDALIIGAAQRVEHYEIAAYGVARAMAKQLGEKSIVRLLDATIKEEGAADKLLTQISEGQVLPMCSGNGTREKKSGANSKMMKGAPAAKVMKSAKNGRQGSHAAH